MTESKEQIIEGSGNVFADLGMKDADELLICAELTHLVHAELRDRRIAPPEAARLLGLEEAEAAQLVAGRFVRFSTERLLHLLTALDRDVDIVVRPRPARQAQARLRVVSGTA
jgi:predicted XRE-type DNA-binding protein